MASSASASASSSTAPVPIKAWAVHAKGAPFVQWTYESRSLGPRDIEMKITHCGICHSDIHTIDSGWGATHYPVVVGHEIIGVVTKKGAEVQHLNIGDRVGVGAQSWACLQKECRDCSRGDDEHCSHGVFTYDSKYPDGKYAYGGYAEGWRGSSDYAFKIPDNLPSDAAAPLLCAGATVWTPMRDHQIGAGSSVAIVGMGGLGHMGVQFAAKLGAEVTVISHSKSKEADAKKLGATHFLDSADQKAMDAARASFDMVLVCACHDGQDFIKLANLCRTRGKLCLVAAPEKPFLMNAFTLIMHKVNFCGSAIASRAEIQAMLDFCSKHNVLPWIEKHKMSEVNECVARVRKGDVRYRFVLEN